MQHEATAGRGSAAALSTDKGDGIRSGVASNLYCKEHGSKLGGGTHYPGGSEI